MANGFEFHPGHWKLENSGAVGLIKEVVEARKVTRRVADLVASVGIPVEYIEDNVSNNQKDNVNWLVAQHNKDVNDTIVSIHFNASGSTNHTGIGTEVLFTNPAMRDLAATISSAISKASGLRSRGAKFRNDIGVLVRTLEPAILIEVCFVNDRKDVELYQKHFEEICMAIAKTLVEYKGKKMPEAPKPAAPQKEEIVLTDAQRKQCRDIINYAIAVGIFNAEAHKGKVDKYTDQELIKYALVYMDRTLRK